MLGFDVSERTVSRWVQRAPRDPDKIARWKAFLKNHGEVIAAMDFFTVHTVTFGVLYCFFIIGHGRRCILPSLAKNLSSFVFNNLRRCHSQAICGSTPPCHTRLHSFWTRFFAFYALAGAFGSKTWPSGNNSLS